MQRPLRILVVMDHGSLGGGTLVAASLLHSWRAAGAVTSSVSLSWTTDTMMEELGPNHQELDRSHPVTKLLALRRVLTAPDVPLDLVFTIGEYCGLVALVARWTIREKRRPVVVIGEHQPALLDDVLARRSPGLLGSVVRKVLRTIRSRSDGSVCLTDGQRTDLVAAGIVNPSRSTVIANPILVDVAPPEAMAARLARRSDDGPVRLITVGSLNAQKNHPMLLRALDRLDARFTLQIIGGGEESEERELLQTAAQLGVSDRVELLGLRRDVPELLDSADLFVLSSDYESFGLVLIEAIARGLPVVTTDCSTSVATLTSECQAFVAVPIGDSDGLAAAVMALSRSGVPLERIQEDARRVVAAHDPAATAAAHLAFFDRTLAIRRAGAVA
jgi:glycosyltransferase involved in cell wall biosynthesis